jgi:hypothetical protein
MMRTVALLMVAWNARPAWAADAESAVPVPRTTEWATTMVLVLVWLLVAAAVIGPMIRYLGWEPARGKSRAVDQGSRG